MLKTFFAPYVLSFFVLLLLLGSCANIVPPQGGPKDETAPVLIGLIPADSSKGKKIKKIELRFDKYMEVRDLENNLSFSPLLPINPTVMAYGKRVEIKIVDSFLEENTTYRLTLGDALVDNREATPYPNFHYVFSTGNYFDSLQLKGRVLDAKTGLPAAKARVVLYRAESTDSAIIRERPSYVQQTSETGDFEFRILPDRPFRIYALTDENNNYYYDPFSEMVAFVDSLAHPNADGEPVWTFFLFREEEPASDTSDTKKGEAPLADSLARATENTRKPAAGTQKPSAGNRRQTTGTRGGRETSTPGYAVAVDTFNRSTGTFDIRGDLVISMPAAKQYQIDTTKIFLSHNNKGIEVEARKKTKVGDDEIRIQTSWQENEEYTLRLVKGWAQDSAEVEVLPGKYIFRTKSADDYGRLTVRFDSTFVEHNYVLQLLRGEDSVFQAPVSHSEVAVPLLDPGTYSLRVFEDANQNGRWDTGKLFEKKQPERVIPLGREVVVRKAWDNEIDFQPQTDKRKKPKAGEDPPEEK